MKSKQERPVTFRPARGRHPVGAGAFWDLANHAYKGTLAASNSCIQFFYAQSEQNSEQFLKACTDVGIAKPYLLEDLVREYSTQGTVRVFEEVKIRRDMPVYVSVSQSDKAPGRTGVARLRTAVQKIVESLLVYQRFAGLVDIVNAVYEDTLLSEGMTQTVASNRRDVYMEPFAQARIMLYAGRRIQHVSSTLTQKRLVGRMISCIGKRQAVSTRRDASEELAEFTTGLLAEDDFRSACERHNVDDCKGYAKVAREDLRSLGMALARSHLKYLLSLERMPEAGGFYKEVSERVMGLSGAEDELERWHDAVDPIVLAAQREETERGYGFDEPPEVSIRPERELTMINPDDDLAY